MREVPLVTLDRLLEIEAGWWVVETRTRSYSPRDLGRSTEATREPSPDEADWDWVNGNATPFERLHLARFFETGHPGLAVALWRGRAQLLAGPTYGSAPLCGAELAVSDVQAAGGTIVEEDREGGHAEARDLRRRLGALRAKGRREAAKSKSDGNLNAP